MDLIRKYESFIEQAVTGELGPALRETVDSIQGALLKPPDLTMEFQFTIIKAMAYALMNGEEIEALIKEGGWKEVVQKPTPE